HAPSATAAIERSYANDVADEFVRPTVIDLPGPMGRDDAPRDGPPLDGPLADGEPIVHANFRADRARQLTHALADATFGAFDRASAEGRPAPGDLRVVTMTEYEEGLPVLVAFPPEVVPCLAGAFEAA